VSAAGKQLYSVKIAAVKVYFHVPGNQQNKLAPGCVGGGKISRY
jgi:hypothetical protein